MISLFQILVGALAVNAQCSLPGKIGDITTSLEKCGSNLTYLASAYDNLTTDYYSFTNTVVWFNRALSSIRVADDATIHTPRLNDTDSGILLRSFNTSFRLPLEHAMNSLVAKRSLFGASWLYTTQQLLQYLKGNVTTLGNDVIYKNSVKSTVVASSLYSRATIAIASAQSVFQ